MLETVGKKLAKARKALSLTIEDVEHRTCIPHGRLRELEDDDYSQFANLTYAKNFLKLYGGFLGVDTSEYRDELSLYEVDDFGADPLANEFAATGETRGRKGAWFGLLFLFLLVGGGGYYYVEYYLKGKEGDAPQGEVAETPVDVDGQVGEGGEAGGSVDLDPTAKPPGVVDEPDVPEVAAEVKEPVAPEVSAEVKEPLATPMEGTPLKEIGDDVPVLPAVVIEDDELLPGSETGDEKKVPEEEKAKEDAEKEKVEGEEAGEEGVEGEEVD